jgi:hypothetical protein
MPSTASLILSSAGAKPQRVSKDAPGSRIGIQDEASGWDAIYSIPHPEQRRGEAAARVEGRSLSMQPPLRFFF